MKKIKEIKIVALLTLQIITANCFAQPPVVGNGTGPGNCLSFNGTSNYVEVSNVPYSAQFTASTWFKAYSLPNIGQAIVQHKGTGSWGTGWCIKYYNNALTWGVVNSTGGWDFFRSTVSRIRSECLPE